MHKSVSVSSNAMDAGQEAFEIRTSRATYLYQKSGCGFSSLIDRDGNDWIGYRPKGGPKGHYRGIPNMGYETFGHPGYETGSTELRQVSDAAVVLGSKTESGLWDVEWTLSATKATMTAHRIASPVWLLYEGTPGGRFNPQRQYIFKSDGIRIPCSDTFCGEMTGLRWVAFCDPKTHRSLALSYEGPDSFVDTYWPMGGKGGMTVFGFGRTDRDGFGFHIRNVPFRFSFALIESVEYEEIAAFANTYLLGN